MGSIGGPELLVVVVVALLVLGPDRLPDALRQAGRGIREVRKVTSGLQTTVRDLVEDADTDVKAKS